MTDESMIIALVIAAAAIVASIAKLASFLNAFTEETRYLCREMDRADSYEEYRRWRGELRCHFLCLIPFVNQNNVMRLYNRIYHRPDKEKKERKDSLVPLMLPSVFAIFVCMVCVCGMTWAWYTASVEAPTQKMTAAYYEVTVESITTPTGNTVDPVAGKYDLEAGIRYAVVLKARGSVNRCGGYCLIQNTTDGEKIYTQTFEPGESITVYFTPDATGVYTFTGIWGSLPIGTEKYLSDKDSAAAPVNDDPRPSDITDPAPAESAPADSAPTESTPTESTPTESTPTDSAPAESVPSESDFTESDTTDPAPAEPSDHLS